MVRDPTRYKRICSIGHQALPMQRNILAICAFSLLTRAFKRLNALPLLYAAVPDAARCKRNSLSSVCDDIRVEAAHPGAAGTVASSLARLTPFGTSLESSVLIRASSLDRYPSADTFSPASFVIRSRSGCRSSPPEELSWVQCYRDNQRRYPFVHLAYHLPHKSRMHRAQCRP